jgi:hypothetical protein
MVQSRSISAASQRCSSESGFQKFPNTMQARPMITVTAPTVWNSPSTCRRPLQYVTMYETGTAAAGGSQAQTSASETYTAAKVCKVVDRQSKQPMRANLYKMDRWGHQGEDENDVEDWV